MTQEEKQLLLKDLCARLPYGVKVRLEGKPRIVFGVQETLIIVRARSKKGGWEWDEYDIEKWNIKPYLRPMSSMTEEEKAEVSKLGVCYDGAFHNDIYDVGIYMEEAFAAISWLLERHFDINYLIHKGLALEAPEGMYNK